MSASHAIFGKSEASQSNQISIQGHLFNSVSKYWTKIDRKRKRKYSLNKPRYFYRDHYF